jgi:hypothetical protein
LHSFREEDRFPSEQEGLASEEILLDTADTLTDFWHEECLLSLRSGAAIEPTQDLTRKGGDEYTGTAGK